MVIIHSFYLKKQFKRVPEKQRMVFNLKYFQEMKYEEISEILGTSVGALKASYHHAVKKIEEFFKPKRLNLMSKQLSNIIKEGNIL